MEKVHSFSWLLSFSTQCVWKSTEVCGFAGPALHLVRLIPDPQTESTHNVAICFSHGFFFFFFQLETGVNFYHFQRSFRQLQVSILSMHIAIPTSGPSCTSKSPVQWWTPWPWWHPCGCTAAAPSSPRA